MPRNQFSFEWQWALTMPGTIANRVQSTTSPVSGVSAGPTRSIRPPDTATSARRNSPAPTSTRPLRRTTSATYTVEAMSATFPDVTSSSRTYLENASTLRRLGTTLRATATPTT
jgi:hypothetical protein